MKYLVMLMFLVSCGKGVEVGDCLVRDNLYETGKVIRVVDLWEYGFEAKVLKDGEYIYRRYELLEKYKKVDCNSRIYEDVQ